MKNTNVNARLAEKLNFFKEIEFTGNNNSRGGRSARRGIKRQSHRIVRHSEVREIEMELAELHSMKAEGESEEIKAIEFANEADWAAIKEVV